MPADAWEMRSPSLTIPTRPCFSSTTGTPLIRDSSSSRAMSWTSVSGDTVTTGLVMMSFACMAAPPVSDATGRRPGPGAPGVVGFREAQW